MHSTPRLARAQLSLLPLARSMLYAGMFMVSLLVFRVAGAITVGDALLVASFLLTAVDTAMSGRRVRVSWMGLLACLLIFAGGLLTSLMAESPGSSAIVLGRVFLLAFLVPWTMSVLLSTPKRFKTGVIALAAGAALCGAGTVLQLVIGDVIPGAVTTSAGRYPGFAAHVSDTGGIVCLAVVYGAGLLFATGKSTKLVGLGLLSAGLAGVILSGSVSGMIAAAAGVLALLVWHRLSIPKLIGLVVVMSVGTWVAVASMSANTVALTPVERFLQSTGLTGDSSLNTTASRWDSIRAAWEIFVASPLLGEGLEPTASYAIGTLPAHNLIVAALFQGGLIFTLGLTLVCVLALCRGLRDQWVRGVSTAAAAGAVAAFVFAMTAPSFYNRYFWVPLILAVVSRQIDRVKRPASARQIRPLVATPTIFSVTAER
ncbi:UNVERIFIED_CONTAM: O-antigen ligase family protein [Kocuria sp. CPCC 205274]